MKKLFIVIALAGLCLESSVAQLTGSTRREKLRYVMADTADIRSLLMLTNALRSDFGGTGLSSLVQGDMFHYQSGTAFSKLAIGSSGRWMGSTGTAPIWNTPAALTKMDDANVTLTLGGSPSSALLNAASLTLGWTGQLSVSRGGSGASTLTGLLQGNGTSAFTTISNSSTVGQVLRVTGDSTYSWGALDLADADALTGLLPITKGGTGQSTATAAFNALSPVTSLGDMIYRNASNNVRLPIGANNTVLQSNGSSPEWRINPIFGFTTLDSSSVIGVFKTGGATSDGTASNYFKGLSSRPYITKWFSPSGTEIARLDTSGAARFTKVEINGTELTSTATTFGLFPSTVSTVNFPPPITNFAVIRFSNNAIFSNTSASTVALSGGSSSSNGGNISLHGSTASNAGDIWFRSGISQKLIWDNSVPGWDFKATDVYNINNIAINGTGTQTIGGAGSIAVFGGRARLNAYTVATLPAGALGDIACVTDALSPTYLTPIVGGGAVKTPVFHDGTNWVAF